MGSLAWAKEDGIRIDERSNYYPKCEICGAEVRRTMYSRKMMYICDECKKIVLKEREKRRKKQEEENYTAGQKRFEKALKKLSKQGVDDSWDKAIKIAMKAIDKYKSVPEVIMAIGLIKTGHSFIPQKKIGSLIPDFILPKEKRVVEVDGIIYHQRYSKEEERDLRLCCMLGKGWDVVHVPAEMVEDNVLYAIAFFVEKEKPKQPYAGDNNP